MAILSKVKVLPPFHMTLRKRSKSNKTLLIKEILENNAKSKTTHFNTQTKKRVRNSKVSGRFIVTNSKAKRKYSNGQNEAQLELEAMESDKDGGAPKCASQKQKLQWIQNRRGDRLYVECVKCGKWRLLDYTDPVQVPIKWNCTMNPDSHYNRCDVPQASVNIRPCEEMIHVLYTAGSLVWAKLGRFPWWPGLVCDCPENLTFYWLEQPGDKIPSHYMVAFFDSERVSRNWIKTSNLISYIHNIDHDLDTSIPKKYRERIQFSKQQANSAMMMDIKARLENFSFLARWPDRINTPYFDTSDDSSSSSDISDTRSVQSESGQRQQRLVEKWTVEDKGLLVKKLRRNSSYVPSKSSFSPKRVQMNNQKENKTPVAKMQAEVHYNNKKLSNKIVKDILNGCFDGAEKYLLKKQQKKLKKEKKLKMRNKMKTVNTTKTESTMKKQSKTKKEKKNKQKNRMEEGKQTNENKVTTEERVLKELSIQDK